VKFHGKYVVLLDMDGPLAAFDSKYWDFCEAHGFDMDITCLTDPARKRFMEENIRDKKQRKIARGYIESGHNHWFLDLPVTPGAEEGVERLLECPFVDLWVCTKPMEANESCRDDKGRWLSQHFPALRKKMILAPDKSLIRGHVLLDDAPRIDWLPRAEWEPVIFPSVFNEAGSQWGHLRSWTWGDSVDELLGIGG
jgi:5'(3')-deoxyribonucleotidase